jgi:hypothetical protein
MATTRTSSYTTGTTGTTGKARKTDEILVVTHREPGTYVYTRITSPLARQDINIECFTSYTWGNEVAFRMVTDNNKKAREIFTKAGYKVQESPVVVWCAGNEPGTLDRATTALAKANIDTYCTYVTCEPNSKTSIVTFNTNDTTKTVNILNGLR